MNQSFHTMQTISDQGRERFEAEATTRRLLGTNADGNSRATARRHSFPWRLGLSPRVVASAATAIMLLGACSDNGPTTLAQGDDVELFGDDGLGARTLNISAEEEDGKVTGEFRNNDVVVRVECANSDTDGAVILGGEVTADPDAEIGVGELLVLIIREGDPDSVALEAPNNAESCTERLESIPDWYLTDDSRFVDVEAGENIKTG